MRSLFLMVRLELYNIDFSLLFESFPENCSKFIFKIANYGTFKNSSERHVIFSIRKGFGFVERTPRTKDLVHNLLARFQIFTHDFHPLYGCIII